jgi:CRISPR/Cas system CMR-associated protein Cmr1 (group 7 of RAMP superfamily)
LRFIGCAVGEIIKVANQSQFDVIVTASHRLTSTIRGIGSTTRRGIDTLKIGTYYITHIDVREICVNLTLYDILYS